MMKLARASSFFDRTDAVDAYSGQTLFRCQIDPFDEAKRDSYAPYRRMMSVAPDVVMPSHRCVRALGQVWIIGESEPDGWGEVHRRKFVVAPANRLLNVASLKDYLEGRPGRQQWAAVYWAKDVKQLESSSQPAQMFDLFTTSTIKLYEVAWGDGDAFLSTSARLQPSGLESSLALMLSHRAEAANLVRRTFSPSQGGYVDEVSEPVRCLRVRWQSLFEYDAETDRKHQEGDISVLAPADADLALNGLQVSLGAALGTPVQANTTCLLRFADASYQVLATHRQADVNILHCRKV